MKKNPHTIRKIISRLTNQITTIITAIILCLALSVAGSDTTTFLNLLMAQQPPAAKYKNTRAQGVDTASPPEIPGMVYIPAGEFTLGSDEGFPYEGPKRKVYLEGFYIDTFEVTNVSYKRFIDATGHKPPVHWKNGEFPKGQDQMPVVNVSYYDAQLYAKWAGKRLPTEIEWEKAARGRDGRKYPWGEWWQDGAANVSFLFGLFSKPHEVGSHPDGKSPYGCFDMAGNVGEITDSFFQPYPGCTTNNPRFGNKYIVLRGGSFKTSRALCLTYMRDILKPDETRNDVGFRCAK